MDNDTDKDLFEWEWNFVRFVRASCHNCGGDQWWWLRGSPRGGVTLNLYATNIQLMKCRVRWVKAIDNQGFRRAWRAALWGPVATVKAVSPRREVAALFAPL